MMVTNRLVNQLQRITEDAFYVDSAVYLSMPTDLTYNDYGHVTSEPDEVPTTCSYNDKPSSESWKDYADVENITGEARFTAPVPKKGDQIKITARWNNVSYTSETFEIVGIRNRGDFGYVVALKKAQI